MPRPVGRGGAGDQVAEERHAHGAAAVDDEHTTEAGLGDELLHEAPLVAADRRDVALEGLETAVLSEPEEAHVGVSALVEEVGGRGHRASIR